MLKCISMWREGGGEKERKEGRCHQRACAGKGNRVQKVMCVSPSSQNNPHVKMSIVVKTHSYFLFLPLLCFGHISSQTMT